MTHPTSSALLTLSPIYERLRQMGYKEEKEHVMIEGVPVQFILPYNPLIEKAIEEAVETKVGKTKTRVFRAEYLAAILFQTGR